MNLFLIGLQRVGSNYLEVILNKNTEDLSFRGYLVEDGKIISKHCFPEDLEDLKNANIPQEGFLIVIRNPYMWLENMCTEETNEIHTDENGCKTRNLVMMYKDFYTEWIDFAKANNIQYVKYEDFLHRDKAEQTVKKIVDKIGRGKVKSNFKLHDEPIRCSMGFTKDDFDYECKETPSKLSKDDIGIVNSFLGLDFIETMGYEAIV
jgi:hypothetical protein